ncbi:MAG: hypothetical protein MPK75_02030 [Alphaproteobacteria bacterium]|nr:hypothetical protein [Alphaproteobacteria bacterium]
MDTSKIMIIGAVGVAVVLAAYVYSVMQDPENHDCRNLTGYVALGPDGIPDTDDDHYFEKDSWAEACLMKPSRLALDCKMELGYDALGPDGIPDTDDDHYFSPDSPAELCIMDPVRRR